MRKAITLSAVVAALAVMAVPALAQAAPRWKVGGAFIGAAKVGVSGSGSLTYTAPPALGSIEFGPCTVSLEGNIWNEPTIGLDEINSFTIHTPCPTSIKTASGTCEITNAVAVDEAGNPPSVDPWESELGVGPTDTIHPAGFVDTLATSTPCAEAGLAGEKVGAFTQPGGSVTGSWNNLTHSLEFANAPGLFVPSEPNTSGLLNGSVELTTAGGLITVE